MDFNQNSENTNYVPNQPSQRPSGFATASLVCGILSLVLCCTGILGIPAGALSILFAVLSKRKGESLSGMSIAGIVTSAIGILLGILAVAYSIYLLFYDPTFREQIDLMMQQMYGVSLEEFFSMYF